MNKNLFSKKVFGIVISFGLLFSLWGSVVFADEPTGLEPPQTAYIEAQQGPEGTTYKLTNLTNADWLANAKQTWKANISCGTFTGTTFNPVGCGDLKAINDNDPVLTKTMRICVFLEHINGEVLFSSYPERGRKHGFGSSLQTPSAEELTCYGSVQESTPAAAQQEQPVVQQPQDQVPINTAPQGTSEQGGGIPWVPITLGVVILGAGAFIFKKRFGDGWDFPGPFSMNDWTQHGESDTDIIRHDGNEGFSFKEKRKFNGNALNTFEPEPDTPQKRKEQAMTPEKTDEQREDEQIDSENKCIAESKVLGNAHLEVDRLKEAIEEMELLRDWMNTEPKSPEGRNYQQKMTEKFERFGGEARLVAFKEQLDEAINVEKVASAAYDACIKKANAERRYISKDDIGVPADYVAPEGEPEEKEVM